MQRSQPQRLHAAAGHVPGEEQAAHGATSACHPCTLPASCHAKCSAAAPHAAAAGACQQRSQQLLTPKLPAALLVLVLLLSHACCMPSMAAARPMRSDPGSNHLDSVVTDSTKKGSKHALNVGGGRQGDAQGDGDAYSSRGDDVYRLEATSGDDEDRARLYAEVAQLYFADATHPSGDEGGDDSGDGGGSSDGLGADSADGRGRPQQQRQLQRKRTPNPPVNLTGTFRGEVWEEGQEQQPSGSVFHLLNPRPFLQGPVGGRNAVSMMLGVAALSCPLLLLLLLLPLLLLMSPLLPLPLLLLLQLLLPLLLLLLLPPLPLLPVAVAQSPAAAEPSSATAAAAAHRRLLGRTLKRHGLSPRRRRFRR